MRIQAGRLYDGAMLDRRWLLGCASVVLACGGGLDEPDPGDEVGLPPGVFVIITGVSVSAGSGGGAGTGGAGATTTVTTGAGGVAGVGGAGGSPPCVPSPSCAGAECGSVPDGCGNMVSCGVTCGVNPDGSACIPTNKCGCSFATDCAQPTHLGAACLAGGVCGCTLATDCATSTRGRACAASVCGCTVANEAVDCAGIGTGLCNAGTLTCN